MSRFDTGRANGEFQIQRLTIEFGIEIHDSRYKNILLDVTSTPIEINVNSYYDVSS